MCMTNKISIDIEALHPWQKDLLAMATNYNGKGTVMMTGRNSGKSILASIAFRRLWEDLHNLRPVEDLELGEGKVYGARYYTVRPVGGSWADMEQWCTETFGKDGGAIWGHDPKKAPLPNERWYMNNSKFWFRNLKDRDWFVMRWSAT